MMLVADPYVVHDPNVHHNQFHAKYAMIEQYPCLDRSSRLQYHPYALTEKPLQQHDYGLGIDSR
jgi:hypothetical protein